MSIDSEMMRDAMSEAMPIAIKTAVRDPQTWAAMHDGLNEYVSEKAGNWLMRSIISFLSRVLLFIVLGSIVYAIGGWSAVVGLFSRADVIAK